jgi:hypothetical protein
LFTDGQKGQFIAPYAPGQTEISTLGVAGLWLGGVDPAGNLKMSVQLHDTGANADFIPGALDGNGTPAALPGIYRVTRAEIEAHIKDFNDNGVIDNPQSGVFGWPARGNSFFAQYHGFDLPGDFTVFLAGFFDRNYDGIYDPAAGDYPTIEIRGCPLYLVPAEMLWFSFHDLNPAGHPVSGGGILQMEVQCQMFSFECDPGDPLNRTVFTRYKLINRGLERLDSTYFGLFTDFNIGNPDDDFFGCDTSRSLVFGYNGDAVDEGFYEGFPPYMGVDLFRGPLNEIGEEARLSTVIQVDTNLLNSPLDFYGLLTGRSPGSWPPPASGINYPGNPTEPGTNSELALGNMPGQRAVLSAYGPFSLQPGAVNEIIAGFYFASDFDDLHYGSDLIQMYFDNCFNTGTMCSAVLDAPSYGNNTPAVRIYPNPVADGVVQIESPEPIQHLRIWTPDGRLVQEYQYQDRATSLQIPVEQLLPGVYFLETRHQNGASKLGKLVRCVR